MSAYNIKWAPLGAEERARKLRVFHKEESMEVDMMKATPGVQKDHTMLESFISHSAIGLLRHFTKRCMLVSFNFG